MAITVGLDIGTKTIAGAVMTGSAKKLHLLDFFVEKIPELAISGHGPLSSETVDLEAGLPPSLGELIKKVLAERKLDGADIVASLDAKDCIIRDRIKVPFTRPEQIVKTIHFEAESHLATFDVEDMVLEFHKVAEMGEESMLILLAFPNKVVAERLATLKEGGVDPVALDLDAAALFNAFALTPTFDPKRTTLLVDIGATTTKVLLIEAGNLKMMRSLRLAAFLGAPASRQIAAPVGAGVGAASTGGSSGTGFDIAESLSIEARFDEIESALRRLDPLGPESVSLGLGDDDEPIAILSDDEYEKIIRGEEPGAPAAAAPEPMSAGEAPAAALAGAQAGGGVAAPAFTYQDFLERLGIEIQRTFSTSFSSPIELIVLTGGMSQRDEARRFFAENYDVETISLDFGDSFQVENSVPREDLNRQGAVAVGLAVKELGRDRLGFDFRKNQFRYERRFEKLKFPLLSLSILACALFLWTSFDQLGKFQQRKDQARFVQGKAMEYFESFFSEKPRLDDEGLLMSAARQRKSSWDKLLGKGEEVPAYLNEVEAVVDIAEVFKAAKSQKGIFFDVERLDLNFQLRTRKGGAAKAESTPELEATVVYSADVFNTGEELRALFKSQSKMWEASPQESQSGRDGSKFKVTLTLSLKKDFASRLAR
jgi:Tfp pilus assembly PilM family ATPase